MNKLSKIALVYWGPFVAFVFYSVLTGPQKTDRLWQWIFGRWFVVYFLGGLVVLPIIAYGLPRVASIKAEILSDRVREGAKRKLQRTLVSIILAIWILTMSVAPPRNTVWATFDVIVFVILLGAIFWLRFVKKGSPSEDRNVPNS